MSAEKESARAGTRTPNLQVEPETVNRSRRRDEIGDYRKGLLAKVQASSAWATLTPTEKRYAARMILGYANPDLSGAMFPSHSTLASKLPTARGGKMASANGRQSRRTALRACSGLVAKGVLVVTPGEDGRAVNTYRVNPLLLSAEAADVTPDVTADVTQKEVLRTSKEALPSGEQGSYAGSAPPSEPHPEGGSSLAVTERIQTPSRPEGYEDPVAPAPRGTYPDGTSREPIQW